MMHNCKSRDRSVLKKLHPNGVVLAYAMNDGMPAQFDGGET